MGGDLSAQGKKHARCSKHISLSTQSASYKCPEQQSTFLLRRKFQARAGQPSGRQVVQQTSPSSTVRWRQVGGGRRQWSARTESCVSAPRCFWSPALLTSPSADRAKVPLDHYIFPHLHLANSFKSNLHCAQPLFLSPPAGTISKSYLPSQCSHHFAPWSKPPLSPGPLQSLPPWSSCFCLTACPPQVARGSI